MKYKRNIKFQYYTMQSKVLKDHVWIDNGAFKFVTWLNTFDQKKGKGSIEFDGMKARVECFDFNDKDEIWAVRFMKLRDTNIPSKVKERESAEAIELAADEYIGEDVTLLYDKKSGIAMIQSNRFALGISRIERFIDCVPLVKDEQVKIRPIGTKVDLKHFKRNRYKSFELKFTDLQKLVPNDGKSALGELIKTFKRFGAVTGKVTISLGKSSLTTLEKKEVENAILELDNDNVDGAKLKVKDDDDSPVEIIDLFDNIENDIIPFELEARETLDFKKAVIGMTDKFLKRLPELRSKIGR